MRTELGISGLLLLYVGNLEAYQGIDLLLQSFALVLKKDRRGDLVIIGGDSREIIRYRMKARHLGIDRKVHFLGAKPVELLSSFLAEADILVSARIRGNNTPMKIYPYLLSGKPVLATNLPTHTQILDSKVAMLAEPSPQRFSEAILRLMQEEDTRKLLGIAGKRLAEEKFSYTTFRAKLNAFLDSLEVEILRQPAHNGVSRRQPRA